MMRPGRTRHISLTAVLAALNATASTASTPQPTAISVPVRAQWYGIDGFWSPVSLRIGTSPQHGPQWVDLLVSTASQETLVIGSAGCDATDTECAKNRGGLFNLNASTTWEEQGTFGLGLDPELGFGGDGVYGYDQIAFNGSIFVPSQTVGVINFNTTDYWLGYFGLGVEPTNFTNIDKPSFLDSIVENQSLVPSHSYGYTAGAHYRPGSVPASLTLGGYDADRFVPHDVSFELDNSQSPVVALNEIIVTADPLPASKERTGWDDESMTLFGSTEATVLDVNMFRIDSTTPYLWLPEPACLQFQNALGLTYDETFQLYTFGTNFSQHETLVNWNMTFHFTVADTLASGKTIVLSLPYKAFDLQLSYPFTGVNATDNPVNYFPLRKANNSTQYTIGRSFLQESYLMVDYERQNFSIYQSTFPRNPLSPNSINLHDITRPHNSTMGKPKVTQKSMMGKGEIAGVAVGAVLAVILLVVIGVLCFRIHRDRRNKRYLKAKSEDPYKSDDRSRKTKSSNSRFFRWLFRLPPPDAPTEIGGAAVWAFEAPDDGAITELPEKSFHSELEGSTTGATDVPAYQEADRKRHVENAVCAIGHDPEKPVELPYRSSARGFFEPDTAPKVQFAPPAFIPARQSQHYRLSRHNTQTSAGISSPSDSPSVRSSKVSSPTFPVSPITPRDFSPQDYSSLTGMARREAWYVANDDRLGDQIPRRPTPAVSLLSESIHSANSTGSNATRMVRKKSSRGLKHTPSVSLLSESGESECSNATTITSRIRKSISRGFSWDPEQCLDQTGPSIPRSAPPTNFNPPPRWNGIRPGG